MSRVCTKIIAPGPSWLLSWRGKVQVTQKQTDFRVFGFSAKKMCNSATIVVAKGALYRAKILAGTLLASHIVPELWEKNLASAHLWPPTFSQNSGSRTYFFQIFPRAARTGGFMLLWLALRKVSTWPCGVSAG